MLNKNVNITKAINRGLFSLFLSASLEDRQLYKVVVTTRYVWVCDIYSCSMYNNNAIKEKKQTYRNKVSVFH